MKKNQTLFLRHDIFKLLSVATVHCAPKCIVLFVVHQSSFPLFKFCLPNRRIEGYSTPLDSSPPPEYISASLTYLHSSNLPKPSEICRPLYLTMVHLQSFSLLYLQHLFFMPLLNLSGPHFF